MTYLIDVVSNEAGSDHPSGGIFRDTALDSHYDCGGIQRLICVDTAKINAVLARSAIALNARDTTQPPPCNPAEPFQVNATAETRRDFIKWAHWIDPATPIPTSTTAPGIPGLYQGSMYCPAGLYRPTYDSKMRSLGRPFEQINIEQHVISIYNLMSPIDGVSPPTTVQSIRQGDSFFGDAVPAAHS